MLLFTEKDTEMDSFYNLDKGGHICQFLTRLMTHRCNSVITISAEDGSSKKGLQFVENVLSLARGLLCLGVKPGDVVALSALNSDLYLEWILAVAYVGGVVAPLNYRWSMEEAISAMNEVRPVMLVIDSSSGYWHSRFRVDLTPFLKWQVLMSSLVAEDAAFRGMLSTESVRVPFPNSVSVSPCCAQEGHGEGAVLICFTSGTTGRPKGVMINHTALVVQSIAKLANVGYSEDDIYLHTAPLCHIGGISSAMAMLMVGACHVFIPKFDALSAINAIAHYKVTSMITVPTMMADIVHRFARKKITNRLESMKKVLNGGGSLTLQLMEDTIKIFPKAKLISAYGMTEACSSLTFKTLYDPRDESYTGEMTTSIFQSGGVCVGKPAAHIELRIKIEDSSDVGRILTRGPHVMIGYWGSFQPDAANPICDGWLDTGDIGHIDDDGNLWLVGRNKGRIKSGGENIYPEEVENVVLQHPGVSGVVVVGVPDTRLTEMVVACVHIKDDWHWLEFISMNSRDQNTKYLSANILQQFCKEMNMTGFKIPRHFVLWKTPFPVTSTGKIKREQMRTDVSSQLKMSLSKL